MFRDLLVRRWLTDALSGRASARPCLRSVRRERDTDLLAGQPIGHSSPDTQARDAHRSGGSRGAFLAGLCVLVAAMGAGPGCLNPQPEPPVEAASTSPPPKSPDDPDSRGGGNGGSGGAMGGGVDMGTDTPGAAGSTASGAAGSGYEGAAGGGGSTNGDPETDNGGAAGSDGVSEGDGTCRPCGQWLATSKVSRSVAIDVPLCEGAVEAIEAVTSCAADSCAACAGRFARGDALTPACLRCFREACPNEVAACLGPPPHASHRPHAPHTD